ncbi:hypothetical protein D3C78_1517290 [compost metagenome]
MCIFAKNGFVDRKFYWNSYGLTIQMRGKLIGQIICLTFYLCGKILPRDLLYFRKPSWLSYILLLLKIAKQVISKC